MITAIQAFLYHHNFQYGVEGPEQNIFSFGIAGENGNFPWLIFADQARNRMQCKIGCVPQAPEKYKSTLMELIIRINEPIAAGAFHLDINNFHISFKYTLILGNDVFCTENMVSEIVMLFASLTDHFYPCFISVINDNMSPSDALASREETLSKARKAQET